MKEEQRFGDDLEEIHGDVESLDVRELVRDDGFELLGCETGECAHGQEHDGTEESDHGGDVQGMALAVLNDAANAETVLQNAKSDDQRLGQRDQIATPQLLEHQPGRMRFAARTRTRRASQPRAIHAKPPPEEMAACSSVRSFPECAVAPFNEAGAAAGAPMAATSATVAAGSLMAAKVTTKEHQHQRQRGDADQVARRRACATPP